MEFRAAVEQSNWYEAARALIDTCDFHFGTDDLDTWLANGDVAHILSRTPQELANEFSDWVGLAQHTTEE